MRRALILAFALLAGGAQAADLSGIWSPQAYSPTLKPEGGGAPPLTPAGKAAYDRNRALAAKGDHSFDDVASACLPPGLPRLMLVNKPFEIIQKPKTVFFVHQENRLPRRVYLDEALPGPDADPMYLGYSVGQWDGETLKVQDGGFRPGTLLDDSGLPHSGALKVAEAWRLVNPDTLEARFTIQDPAIFTKPWSAVVRYRKRPGLLIPEEVCAERLKTTAPRGSR